MDQIKVGLIGYGMSGTVFHGPLISSHEKFELTGIVTTNEERIKGIKSRYPKTKIYSSVEALLENKEITLVIIGTPNQSHFSIAKKALLKDKDVILEKPLTITSKAADELIKLSKKKNKMLTAYHNRRLDSDFLTVKALIEEKGLGEVKQFISHFDRFSPEAPKNKWRYKNEPGSGVLFDLGSHLIDQALVLFGKPKEIFADLRKERKNSETIDAFHVVLFYEDKRVILNSSFMVKGEKLRFQVNGTKGTFKKYGLDIQEELLSKGETPDQNGQWGVEPRRLRGHLNTVDTYKPVESKAGNYPYFYDNVYEHIMLDKPLLVTPEEARNVIRLIELAYASHEKKAVVKVIF
jgi:predicted dehydrogenase